MNRSTKLSEYPVADRLGDLPTADRRLLVVLGGLSVVALFLGLLYATAIVLQMLGVLSLEQSSLYTMLTLHATTAFYYWLYFVQAATMLTVIRMYAPTLEGLAWRRVGWAGTALMTGGFVLNTVAAIAGATLTYAALPNLGSTPWTTWFYGGYLLLAVGLLCLAATAFRTALLQKQQGRRSWPALTFASVLWWGLAAVSVIASVNAYLPPLLSSIGVPVHHQASYLMNWSVLFHNMHYLPLISAVVVWYVIAEDATSVSVKLIYSSRFSKAIFAFYLLVVPPTSLYHMFLSPSVSPAVKTVGSILALFMSIPTVLHFVVIVSSLELAARSQGATGILGWIRTLPWENPGFACCGAAVASAIGGGLLANVIVQHGFASLLSDTYFVPAYLHFFTVGVVSLTFVGALVYFLPALTARPLPAPRVMSRLPALVVGGLYVFGVAGTIAGYYGVPRRTIDVAYGSDTPDLWGTLVQSTAVGGFLMAAGLLGFTVLLAWLLLGWRSTGLYVSEYQRVNWYEGVDRSRSVVSGVITIGVLLFGWILLTVLTNVLMNGLPIV